LNPVFVDVLKSVINICSHELKYLVWVYIYLITAIFVQTIVLNVMYCHQQLINL